MLYRQSLELVFRKVRKVLRTASRALLFLVDIFPQLVESYPPALMIINKLEQLLEFHVEVLLRRESLGDGCYHNVQRRCATL